MKKTLFSKSNLSSEMMYTQPSTLFPYFSPNNRIREKYLDSLATKGAFEDKGFDDKTPKEFIVDNPKLRLSSGQ